MPAEAQLERFRAFLSGLLDVASGDLFWAQEDAWEQTNPDYSTGRRHDRASHPGCVHRTITEPVQGHVRMLHGHSEKKAPPYEFAVCGLDGSRSERVTWFDVLHPYLFPMEMFFAKRPLVYRNEHKPALSAEERRELERIEDLVVAGIARDEAAMQEVFSRHFAWQQRHLRDVWPAQNAHEAECVDREEAS